MGKERWRWGADRSRDGDIIAKISTDNFNGFSVAPFNHAHRQEAGIVSNSGADNNEFSC